MPAADSKAYSAEYYRKNAEKIKAKARARRESAKELDAEAEREKRREYKRRARRRAGVKVRLHEAHVKAWLAILRQTTRMATAKHDAHVVEWRRSRKTWGFRYKNDPEFAAAQRMRTFMRKHAAKYSWVHAYFGQGAKKCATGRGRMWGLLGYSPADLRAHLESRFVAGMDWHSFLAGRIHIDHIIPKRLFDLETEDGLRACYALSNLQPLWSEDNLKKGGRIIGCAWRAAVSKNPKVLPATFAGG